MRVNSNEFYLWLNGYLEALESEGIKTCKIDNIRKQMEQVVPVNPYPVQMPRQVIPRGPQINPQVPSTPHEAQSPIKEIEKKKNKKFSESVSNPLDKLKESPIEKGYAQRVLEAESKQGLR